MRLGHALRLNNQSNIVSDGILPLGGRYHDKTSALHSEFAQRSHVSQSHTHKSVFSNHLKRQVSENVLKEYCV